MKLSSKQLRALVLSEATTRSRWGDPSIMLSRLINGQGDVWKAMYDENDPSMAALGREAWEDQVVSALAELEDRIADLIEETESKLIEGFFY
jgi:hypothetical protein